MGICYMTQGTQTGLCDNLEGWDGEEIGGRFKGERIYVSVQLSHSVVSDCLRPQEPQHARPPCPPPTPGVHPNPCPLSQ